MRAVGQRKNTRICIHVCSVVFLIPLRPSNVKMDNGYPVSETLIIDENNRPSRICLI